MALRLISTTMFSLLANKGLNILSLGAKRLQEAISLTMLIISISSDTRSYASQAVKPSNIGL
jgi:predicted amino acid-binding ACT domain protein